MNISQPIKTINIKNESTLSKAKYEFSITCDRFDCDVIQEVYTVFSAMLMELKKVHEADKLHKSNVVYQCVCKNKDLFVLEPWGFKKL